MKISHKINQILKQYNKNREPDIQKYRDFIHSLISLENNFFYPNKKEEKLYMYLGETDAHFIKNHIYNLTALEINKYNIKKAIGEQGVRYIIINELGYKFIEVDIKIDEAVLHNLRIE